MKKISSYIYFLLSFMLCTAAFANNGIYIATSNNMARQKQLEVTSNNAANAATIGFEQDNTVFEQRKHKSSKRKKEAYVIIKGNYHTSDQGGLKQTNRPLDMAVIGKGYFMVITPKGPRYTLDGRGIINGNNILVNHDNYPYASRDEQPIVFPEQYKTLEILNDGTVFADEEEIGLVGVFDFQPGTELAKEGNNLYSASNLGFILEGENVTVAGGYLRESNVNSTKVLTDVIELQRSNEVSQEMVKNIASMEQNTISKLTKN